MSDKKVQVKPEKKTRQFSSKKIFQAIGFNVEDEEYGLEIKKVQSIVKVPFITRVPKAPDYIKGVINLRGNVIPVIDIAIKFEIGITKITKDSRIVVVEHDQEITGLISENVSKVKKIPEKKVTPPPPMVSKIAEEYIKGVYRQKNNFLIFLNLEKVLNEE